MELAHPQTRMAMRLPEDARESQDRLEDQGPLLLLERPRVVLETLAERQLQRRRALFAGARFAGVRLRDDD